MERLPLAARVHFFAYYLDILRKGVSTNNIRVVPTKEKLQALEEGYRVRLLSSKALYSEGPLLRKLLWYRKFEVPILRKPVF